jgi:DNA-binding CsgD family transcriptional regulator
MTGPDPQPRLYGRRRECEALDELVQQARAGRSSVLVVRGEPGVGKTALLRYVAAGAAGFRVERAAGVECEMELPFAGLHQLCASMLGPLERLPGPQSNALRLVFGLADGEAPDAFLVALAVLSLLSEAAEEQPLLCIIDDVQWLDRASMQALAFAARRLLAERVALVFAVREPTAEPEVPGLPELVVEGLAETHARRLLTSALRGPLDLEVQDRILAETRGNPLALLELPRSLAPEKLAGGFGLPGNRPLSNRIEASFHRRLKALPRDTQRLVLAAAAEPLGDIARLWRAAELLGIDAAAVEPAKADGLIEVGARVRFPHPLVRSAIYQAASSGDRVEVHRALAEATDPDTDPDRRAWHRARAAVRPDEAIARELERSAARARARGGAAAAAAFLERATELTPDPRRRGARALDAAKAKFDAAAPDAASALLAIAQATPLDALQHARAERLRAQIAFSRRRGSDAPPLLLRAAERLTSLDPQLARETYLDALGAAIFAGRLGRDLGVYEVARAALAAPPPAEPPRTIDLLLDGLARTFTEGHRTGVPALRRALRSFRGHDSRPEADRWLWLACRVAPEVWDDESWHALAERGVAVARDTGALTLLPIALTYRAGVAVHAGEFDAAAELVEEADAIIRATGNAPLAYTSLVLAAWRGRPDPALAAIEAGMAEAAARGEGRAIALAEYATAVLHNGLGAYDAALRAAERAREYQDLGLYAWTLSELIEAAVRCGRPELAVGALEELADRTGPAGTDWALGMQARARALVSGDDPEPLYQEAIERLARTRIAVHLARARLLYGEWLRRASRRVDAREQLHAAHDSLAATGADAFAERARRELEATGETARRRAPEARDDLTAQEALIARLASEGRSNPEIAAQLFISPRTVEYHLHKVYAKLAISSRTALRERLQSHPAVAVPT